MDVIRKFFAATFLLAALLFSSIVNAALVSNATLSIDAGQYGQICAHDTTYTGGICTLYVTGIVEGSYFELETYEPVSIEGYNGITLGIEQLASDSHLGLPNGSESPNIDQPWNFIISTGMHLTSGGGINIISDNGAGNVVLDFSDWGLAWNDIPFIDLGMGSHSGGIDGQAVMTCSSTCENGDSYSLVYYATIPTGDVSGFGGGVYTLNLEGTINPVPVPTAIWLFGSGLLGLIGLARHKKV